MKILSLVFILLLAGCSGLPEGIEPVAQVDLERYQGRWYEIARLDHRFERGLKAVTADYTLSDETGHITVVNRGLESDGNWKEAIGRARRVSEGSEGHLEVSFFGPFYSSYVIFFLEEDYSVALVSGYSRDYFWILARTPSLPASELTRYVDIAQRAGFATDDLIYTVNVSQLGQ